MSRRLWCQWVARALTMACLVLVAGAALAHKSSDSYLTVQVQGDQVSVQWDIALRDIQFAIGLDANGDTQVLVGPTPDGSYSLRFNVVKRQPDLSANTDVLLIPSQPVIHYSVALLTRERGETGGTTAQDYFLIADRHLSDAVAIDAYKNPEEFIYRVP